MSDNRKYPPMTYEQLKQSHSEWRMLAMHNYSACAAEKERADKLEDRHNSFLMVVQEATEHMTWRNAGRAGRFVRLPRGYMMAHKKNPPQ